MFIIKFKKLLIVLIIFNIVFVSVFNKQETNVYASTELNASVLEFLEKFCMNYLGSGFVYDSFLYYKDIVTNYGTAFDGAVSNVNTNMNFNKAFISSQIESWWSSLPELQRVNTIKLYEYSVGKNSFDINMTDIARLNLNELFGLINSSSAYSYDTSALLNNPIDIVFADYEYKKSVQPSSVHSKASEMIRDYRSSLKSFMNATGVKNLHLVTLTFRNMDAPYDYQVSSHYHSVLPTLEFNLGDIAGSFNYSYSVPYFRIDYSYDTTPSSPGGRVIYFGSSKKYEFVKSDIYNIDVERFTTDNFPYLLSNFNAGSVKNAINFSNNYAYDYDVTCWQSTVSNLSITWVTEIAPTPTPTPTATPTASPTATPTNKPTASPTATPTNQPSTPPTTSTPPIDGGDDEDGSGGVTAGLFQGFWDWIVGKLTAILDAIGNLVSGIVGGIQSIADGLFKNISEFFKPLFDGVGELISSLSTNAVSIYNTLTGYFDTFWDKLAALFGSISLFVDTSIIGDGTINFDNFMVSGSALASVFPFCLPNDILELIKGFAATPVAPKLVISFQSLKFFGGATDIEIDFNEYDTLASIIRFFVFMSFTFYLIVQTRSIIRA